MLYQTQLACASPYVDVRYPDGWIAFRYDPKRGIVEIQRRGQKFYFDLAKILSESIDKSD